jgi:hypothetical protein
VITAARDQPHTIAVALDPQSVAVKLDLVEPIRAAGDLEAATENAELKSPRLRRRASWMLGGLFIAMF